MAISSYCTIKILSIICLTDSQEAQLNGQIPDARNGIKFLHSVIWKNDAFCAVFPPRIPGSVMDATRKLFRAQWPFHLWNGLSPDLQRPVVGGHGMVVLHQLLWVIVSCAPGWSRDFTAGPSGVTSWSRWGRPSGPDSQGIYSLLGHAARHLGWFQLHVMLILKCFGRESEVPHKSEGFRLLQQSSCTIRSGDEVGLTLSRWHRPRGGI